MQQVDIVLSDLRLVEDDRCLQKFVILASVRHETKRHFFLLLRA